MYNQAKAKELGLITICNAHLEEPVTLGGYYRCVAGHAHHVSWNQGQLTTSDTGYDRAFLEALNAADYLAIAIADPETERYETLYNEVVRQRGYGHVLDPKQ